MSTRDNLLTCPVSLCHHSQAKGRLTKTTLWVTGAPSTRPLLPMWTVREWVVFVSDFFKEMELPLWQE